jgi:hypothetical protein
VRNFFEEKSEMLDRLRKEMSTFLSNHKLGVMTATVRGKGLPVRYTSKGLDLYLALPRWSELAYHLEQDTEVQVVIMTNPENGDQCWLEYLGKAQEIPLPELLLVQQEELADQQQMMAYRISPERLDLFDITEGRFGCNTLELFES